MRCPQRHTGCFLVGCGWCVSQFDALVRLLLGAVCRLLCWRLHTQPHSRPASFAERTRLGGCGSPGCNARLCGGQPSAAGSRCRVSPHQLLLQILFCPALCWQWACANSPGCQYYCHHCICPALWPCPLQVSTGPHSNNIKDYQPVPRGGQVAHQAIPPNNRPLTSKPCPQFALKSPALRTHTQHAAIQN